MTPKCCQICTRNVERERCPDFRKCRKYARWFHSAWSGIQAAAQKIKEKEEEAKENIEE